MKYAPVSWSNGPTGKRERLDDVYQYVSENFSRKISLQEISKVANYSPNAFCRFFKNNTGKTFVQYLLEVRVAHACALIADENKNLKT
ncbi:MAG: helix-turn-helix transcriptional regulator, partial [Bacteroidetes bacterium]|nr:helix-turn-helix transcriptional regulator [Bacteroidota bacterium]